MTRTRAARGMTLVEAAIASVILATLGIAVMRGVAGLSGMRRASEDAVRGRWLADVLMSEITALPFEEVGESKPPSVAKDAPRDPLNDVDDYDGYKQAPPRWRDGKAIAGYSAWRWSAEVRVVEPTDLTLETSKDTGVKRVTVEVSRDGRRVTRAVSVRTRGVP